MMIPKRILKLAGLAAIAVAVTAASESRVSDTLAPQQRWRVATVERGPITAAVSASGSVRAVVTVQVGSQVSGQVKELLADFNSVVKQGEVLARLDPDHFQARVAQARADLAVASAGVLAKVAHRDRAAAGLAAATADLARLSAQIAKAQVVAAQARREAERRQELVQRNTAAPVEQERAEAAHQSAQAELRAAQAEEQSQRSSVAAAEAALRAAEADIATARAVVQQREAALTQAQIDLDHTVIRAPIDGVVVSRDVDLGQTVAASLQAPLLFLVAQDLRQVRVHADIDEADMGRIRVGQAATFTVDAFRTETFQGRVVQIRKAPVTVQNVVTYTVVVSADNPKEKLLPGMTANLRIVTVQRDDVIKVPNAALRFQPSPTAPGPSRGARSQPVSGETGAGATSRIWIVGPDQTPHPISVGLGGSDGNFTEVTSPQLAPGQQIILGMAGAAAGTTMPARP